MTARVLRWLPLPILAVGALGAWGLSLGRPPGPEEAHVSARLRVPVIEVELASHRPIVRAYGTVSPRSEVALVAEVGGRVRWIAASLEAGSFFGAGDVLVEIDRVDAELALERAEADAMRRRSERGLAEARLARLRSLAANGVASPVEIEEAEHALELARAGLREANAAREQARRDLERTRIRAPFDGRVRGRSVNAGQFVVRGTPLAQVYAVDSAEVRLPLTGADLALLERPISNAPRVTLRAQLGDRTAEWQARLVREEGEIAARSRMQHVVARVEDPYGRRGRNAESPLTVGLFVEAEIEGRAIEGVALPHSALGEDSRVWVVGADARQHSRRVEVAGSDADRFWVGSGLSAGERVLVSAAGASEGLEVLAVPVDPSAPAPLAALDR